MNNVLCAILVISPNVAGLCREVWLAIGPYWIFLSSHLSSYLVGVFLCQMSPSLRYIKYTVFYVWFMSPGHIVILLLKMHRMCGPKENCYYTMAMYIRIISWKVTDFRSSWHYWPWGILNGVGGSHPAEAVALLLGVSGAQSVKKLCTIRTLYGGRNWILWRPTVSQKWRESM